MICAIVLAAGRSRRMGTQKLLLPFGGRTVIEHIVGEVAAGSVEHIVVVTGNDGAAVSAALAGRRLIIVPNPDLDSQMLQSVRCGLAAAPGGSAAVLIVLGDQPAIRREWIQKLISSFRQSGGERIVVPLHDGHRGHPMLIPARFIEELLTRHDDSGIRGLLDAHADEVIKLQWGEESVLADMDFPADYRRELERAGHQQP